jgi:enoyl-CoA hydratase
MSEPVLRIDKQDEIAVVTLNRPHAMNALSSELRSAIAEAFERLQADPNTGAVVLTGAGRAFCAGLDLKELSIDATSDIGNQNTMQAIRAFEGPIIGAVNGFAITGGFELALACDVLIASPDARFADTHARVGILPGWGLSQILPRLIGEFRAKEMSLTGNFVDAERAEAWGIVNRIVPADELVQTAIALAGDMLSCDRRSLLGYKKLINDGMGMTFADAMKMEARLSAEDAASVTAESIAVRRDAVQDRGRTQGAD